MPAQGALGARQRDWQRHLRRRITTEFTCRASPARVIFPPSATICHNKVHFGANVYVDDGVLFYEDRNGGAITLGAGVHLHRDTFLQTGQGGTIEIGPRTHIQPRCQFSAYLSPIIVGSDVEIAPYCAFYPYDHGVSQGVSPIAKLPYKPRAELSLKTAPGWELASSFSMVSGSVKGGSLVLALSSRGTFQKALLSAAHRPEY